MPRKNSVIFITTIDGIHYEPRTGSRAEAARLIAEKNGRFAAVRPDLN